jgi:hypothetical protein
LFYHYAPEVSIPKMSHNVITYREGVQPERIYTFLVRNANGHLYVNFWDGVQWNWADQGAPKGVKVWGVPGVITYPGAGKQRIYAFVTSEDGHLYVNFWDGVQWNWADHGTPQGTKLWGAQPGVVTYLEAGKQRIYAFVTDLQNHLYVNFWDGVQWKWANQGTPPGTTVFGAPGVIAYPEAGEQRIYAFIKGANGHLYVNFWDGAQWKWADQGKPPGTTTGGKGIQVGPPGVITYPEAGKQRIYTFVQGQNSHLYVNFWDGVQWNWANQSPATGEGALVEGEAKVITYLEAGKQRIYAFVRSLSLNLLVNFWDGAHWKWAVQGGGVLGPYGAITYVEATKQRIYAFVGGDTGHLLVNFWDGTHWKWADLGDFP